MAAKLTEDERQRIIDLCQQGKSRNDISDITGRSHGTISSIAASIGHTFGQSNAARAHEARSAYSAERRAQIAARLTHEVDQLLDQLHESHLAFNFGGKDNTYEEHELEEPPIDGKRALIQAAREAMRTVLDIDRHDNRGDEDIDAVSRWLRDIVGGST